MNDLENKVHDTVQGFVAQIVELVRTTALESLHVAFTAPGAIPTEARGDRASAAGSPGRRRTPEDLEVLARRVAFVVRTQPGLRIAELAARLGTPTRHLSVPIRKLVAEGAIRPQGRRRATTYVAAAMPDAPDAQTAAAPAASSSAPPPGLDVELYRSLAHVYLLAHKLDR